MKIDFPNTNDSFKEIPPETVFQEYQLQMNMFKHYQKQQFDQNSLYLKLMGFFVLISTTYFVLQAKGVLVNFLIGTTIVGVGTLYIMLATALFLDPQRDHEVARRIKIGKFLEEKYSNIISVKLFHQ